MKVQTVNFSDLRDGALFKYEGRLWRKVSRRTAHPLEHKGNKWFQSSWQCTVIGDFNGYKQIDNPVRPWWHSWQG